MAKIFISYRREDSAGHAGRLCDRLTARFGNTGVFMDLQDIAPGQNFARSIDDMMATCDCVVAVIGPRWVEAVRNRARDTEDFVRHEIAAALQRDITVIPVLVGGAHMPRAEDLPAALSSLRQRNAFEIRDERFEEDVTLLSDAIARQSDSDPAVVPATTRGTRATALIVVAVTAGAGAAAWLLRPAESSITQNVPATGAQAAAGIDGDWVADVQKEGQPPFRIRLSFAVLGESITGIVHYPTGDGPVLDARRVGNILTFHTSHVPQFESAPAVIRYQGEIAGDEIRFSLTDQYSLAKASAQRAVPNTQR